VNVSNLEPDSACPARSRSCRRAISRFRDGPTRFPPRRGAAALLIAGS